MRVGVIQTAAGTQVQEVVGDAVRKISSERCDLWVLPELFHTSLEFTSRERLIESCEEIPGGPVTQELINVASKSGTFIIAGIAEKDEEVLYNSAVLVGPTGVLAKYRKLHLFYREKAWFTPGNLPLPVVDIGLARIGMMICFDHFFPETARTLAFRGADVIAHPAGLFVADVGQRTMQVRARENGVYAITPTRVGREHAEGGSYRHFVGCSQIVSPTGAVIFKASAEREEVGFAEIDPALARDKSIGLTDENHEASIDRFRDRQTLFYEADPL